MKTLQMVPACRNADELQRIVALIRECAPPAMVILFGHYAGMTLQSVYRGYELLVLFPQGIQVSGRQLLRYVNEHFPPEVRLEKDIFFYVFPIEQVSGAHHCNYFFQSISQEGYVLYDSGEYTLWRRNNFKCVRARQKAEADAMRYLELGQHFLTDAEQHLSKNERRATAFLLYQSARLFLSAVVWTYYGYEPQGENSLISNYTFARHCSGELSQLWDMASPQGKQSLHRLHSFNYRARFQRQFICPIEELAAYFQKISQLGEAAKTACEARIALLYQLCPASQNISSPAIS